jgi:6-pyruvoyltetrahydropterin/6-carboxytetrahydropterin synthase
MYSSTKTFGHEIGLSAAFRQWKAQSHCRLIHGYALSIKLKFSCEKLDGTNWCADFGSFKSFKKWLEDKFDHTLLVAEDDPQRDILVQLDQWHGAARVVIVPATGCEAFAKLIYERAQIWLEEVCYAPRVWIESVEVREHGANSAIYYGEE